MANAISKPKRKVFVTLLKEVHLPFDELRYYWVFGPNTYHAWPSGDFYDSHMFTCQSAWTFEAILNRPDMVRYDPDLCVDKGL